MSTETIKIMETISTLLDSIPDEEKNEENQKIKTQVTDYLRKYTSSGKSGVDKCSHEIVQDFIDIDVEHTKMIYYCINCFETFQGFDGNS